MMTRPAVAVFLLLGCGSPDGEPPDPDPDAGWRSALYPEDWTPGFGDQEGRRLHDFSYAGYRLGEEPPSVAGPVVDVRDHGADPSGERDSTAAIQAAIDATEAGVVWLPEGTYRIDGLLRVRRSGVVVRGDGPGRTVLGFTATNGVSDRGMLSLEGRIEHGEDRPLTVDGAPFDRWVRVADVQGLSVGDEVSVGWTITPEFIAAHGMTGTWEVSAGRWRAFFRRQITGIEPSSGSVQLDVPLRYPALLRDGASLRSEGGVLTEVGVEALSVSTAVAWADAWASTRNHAILLSAVRDGWVRDVTSVPSPFVEGTRELHLQSGGVKVADSARVTLAALDLREAQNRGEGGNGYLVEIGRSSEVLVRDSTAMGGRHNFIQNWDFGTSGCVFLRTTSAEGRAMTGQSSGLATVGFSEFHHMLAMANLIDDSVADDGWAAVNRRSFSSGAGHAGTESVFWNLRGSGVLRSFQFGHGYVIGTRETTVFTALDTPDLFRATEGTEPEDWSEGLDEGESLRPQSLYEDQRERRLAGAP